MGGGLASHFDKEMNHAYSQMAIKTAVCSTTVEPAYLLVGYIAETWLILGYMLNTREPLTGMEILMEWSRGAAGNGKSPAAGMQRKSTWDQAPTRQP